MQLWQSTKQPPQQTLTVVTALSKQRLPMLEAQCLSWSGPLTAVLYEPSVSVKAHGGQSSSTTVTSTRKQARLLLQEEGSVRGQIDISSGRLSDAQKAIQESIDR